MKRRAREARGTIMNREQIKFTGTWLALTSVILDGYLQRPISRYFRISLPSSSQILINLVSMPWFHIVEVTTVIISFLSKLNRDILCKRRKEFILLAMLLAKSSFSLSEKLFASPKLHLFYGCSQCKRKYTNKRSKYKNMQFSLKIL